MTSPTTEPSPEVPNTFVRRLRRWLHEAVLLVVGLVVLVAFGLGGFFYWLSQREFEEGGLPAGHEVSFPVGVRPAILFFAAAGGDSLVPVFRFVPESTNAPERAARLVAELGRGPDGPGQLALLPPGATVRHAFLDEDGRLYLDFDAGLARRFAGGSTAEYLCLSSLVRTLAANLPEIRSVTLSVAGSPLPTLGGHFPLQEELEVSEWW